MMLWVFSVPQLLRLALWALVMKVEDMMSSA